MIRELHIFDFDGTLVDSSHRYRTLDNNKIDLAFWRANVHLTKFDKLLPLFKFFKKLKKDPKRYPIIATARIWDDYSKEYAKTYNIDGVIISRKPNDNQKGATLKINRVKRLLNLKQFKNVNKIVVYEDNVEYLEELMRAFGAYGVFVESNQGH